MKNYKHTSGILAAIASVLLAASCNQKAIVPDSAKGPAALSVTVEGINLSTKVQTNDEMNVTRLQVAIYNESGRLEWQEAYNGTFSISRTVTGLEVGPKTVVAVANKDIIMPDILEDFWRMPTTLGDNSRDRLVMTGSVSTYADVTPGDAKVMLERVAARISMRNAILINWMCAEPSQFSIDAIYVANVQGVSTLGGDGSAEPGINLRTSAEIVEDPVLKGLTYAARADEKDWKGSGDVFKNGVDFYVYPNTTETRTALILQTTFNGHKSYYPLVIDQDIVSNTLYRCGTITLTSDGMPTPEEAFSNIKVTLAMEKPADWDEKIIQGAKSITF